jgi:hypothetical protein
MKIQVTTVTDPGFQNKAEYHRWYEIRAVAAETSFAYAD